MEAFLFLLAGKISSALGGEALKGAGFIMGTEISMPTEVEGLMGRIKSEFEHIQAFLSDIDTRKYNRTVQPWLRRVREIAQDAEDVIDNYMYLTGGERSQSRRLAGVRRALNRNAKIRAWHSIATQLKGIEANLAHATSMKERYDIKKLDSEAANSLDYVIERDLRPITSSYAIDDDEIVGVVEERMTLLRWLTDEAPTRGKISVWGMGGLGKTTLVGSVCKRVEVEKRFDCQAWVSVSQTYQKVDLLKQIIRGFLREDLRLDLDSMEAPEIELEIQQFLQDKRYLVVLDDVWSQKAFQCVQEAFADSVRGSRIVITTRNRDLALLADDGFVLGHRRLTQEEAWELFRKKAFWRDDLARHPREIENLGRDIVKKCDGLPLAIVAIARVMSLRRKIKIEWKHIYDRLDWELTNNPDLDNLNYILSLSYDYLPGYLKNCFLYCSIFPEDHSIKRKRLIRLWIAEGFVEVRGTQTLEEVAEEYLHELIHRCMLEVAERNSFGRVRSCRMHDLMRELTLTSAKKDKFSMVQAKSNNKTMSRIGEDARRFSVHDCDAANDRILMSMNYSRTRSFFVFDSIAPPPKSLLSLVSSEARCLRVLDLQGAPIDRIPAKVTELFNLHYLSLRQTKVKQLPKSLGRLQNLQTLDLGSTSIEKLPKGTIRLRNLQHIIAWRYDDSRGPTFCMFTAMSAPKGLWKLTGLTRLEVAADEDLVLQLGNLTQLRILFITKVRGIHCRQLCASLSQMPFLYNLAITASDENELLHLEGLCSILPNIQKLILRGRLEEAEVWQHVLPALGDSLQSLYLGWTGLRKDPLPALACLQNLASLGLHRAYDGERILFPAGQFPRVSELYLSELPNVTEITMERGSMERLTSLILYGLSRLKEVPQGIESIASLQKLHVSRCNDGFVQMMKGLQRSRLQHILEIRHGFVGADGKYTIEILSSP